MSIISIISNLIPFTIRVKDVLDVPNQIKITNNSIFTGEEVMLFSINRLTSSAKLSELADVYGKETSQWSRAFNWFVDFVLEKFKYTISGHWKYWRNHIPSMANAIRTKMEDFGVHFDMGNQRIFSFIDCTIVASNRPGGGPAHAGVNALRYNNNIQRGFYSGFKKHHGTKFQTVESPIGICMHCFGPRRVKDSDLQLLNRSRITTTLNNLFAAWGIDQYVMYGDGIYPYRVNLISKHMGNNLTPRHIRENQCMKSLRVSNEWAYGVTANIFPYVKNRKSVKLLSHKNHSRIYKFATIMRNVVALLYGNIVQSHFDTSKTYSANFFDMGLEDLFQIQLEDYFDAQYM
jgi:hypothetical protein